ncbi:MAG: gephyrin-like molybdotransferase Glp [Vicinamibacterales bacterium]
MRADLFSTVISFDAALRCVLETANPVDGTESLALANADGRVCAVDVIAGADVPSFDRAAMDGFAVRSADLATASVHQPARLSLVGELFAGMVPDRPLEAGTCMAIATGAPVPAGADAVVMVEAALVGATSATFSAPAIPPQHIGPRGADMRAGDTILRQGECLTPARLGSLAAIGRTAIEVFRKPSILIASSGNEVTAPGIALPRGHVYDVNGVTLGAVIQRHGGTPVPASSVQDSVDALVAVLDEAAGHDVVVVSGGSSVGERDLLLDAVQQRGSVLFHGIAVKPGKPTLFGKVGRTPVFGMPGNPTSCLSNAYMLLVPFLRKMARLPSWAPLTVEAPLARRVSSAAGRHQFYPVRLVDGRVEPVFKSSGDITSMAGADGFIEIPADVAALDEGVLVTVKLF